MKKLHRFLTAGMILCCLVPATALTAEGGDPGCQPSWGEGMPGLFEPPFAYWESLAAGFGKEEGKVKDPGEAASKAICSAQCHNGSYVTCWGQDCAAYDNRCSSSSFAGYCYGTDTGYRYCPSCPTCTKTVTATCSPSGSVSCTGTCAGSFAVNGCYAYCDGNQVWCPNPDDPCPF